MRLEDYEKNVKLFLVLSAMTFLLVLATSCDLTPTQKEQMKAQILHDGAKAIVLIGTKNKPELKKKVLEICDNVDSIIASGKLLQIKHVAVLISQLNIDKEMRIIATDLTTLLITYLNFRYKDPLQTLSQTEMLFMVSFFKGIREGSK